jgi:voltage-gated potassium channel
MAKKLSWLEKHPKIVEVLDRLWLLLIALNVLAVIYGTEENLYQSYKSWFDGFELFSILIFTLEYVLRLVFCVQDKRYQKPFSGRLKYALTPMALIDLFSFLPFYLPFLIPMDLRVLRAIRLLRIFRILKIFHHSGYSNALTLIAKVFHNRRKELAVTFSAALVIVLISSSLMYFAEHDAQPTVFPDIPSTIWWCVMTLSTIGYHEIYPVTFFGRFIGAFISLVGIGLFALPAGILGSGFVEEIRNEKKIEEETKKRK